MGNLGDILINIRENEVEDRCQVFMCLYGYWGYTMFDNESDKVNQKCKFEKITKKLSKFR